MEMGKSLLAVTVIENVEHVCKFPDCEELFALDQLGYHEKSCRHRTVSCPFGGCLVTISLSTLLDHFKEGSCSSHKEQLKVSSSFVTAFRFPNDEGLKSFAANWPFESFSYEDSSFVLCAGKIENHFFFTMVMLGSKEECSEYKVDMVVHEYDSQATNSEISFKYSGNPCSIDEDKQRVKYLGLTVTFMGMDQIVRKSESRLFNVSCSLCRK